MALSVMDPQPSPVPDARDARIDELERRLAALERNLLLATAHAGLPDRPPAPARERAAAAWHMTTPGAA
jgi:hypothetical protein